MAKAATPLGIIAAAGPVPLTVAEQVTASGRDVIIIALKSIADADFDKLPHYRHRLGAVAGIIDRLKQAGVEEIVMAGRFTRPKMASVMPDMRGAKLLSKALMVGDDEALNLVKNEFAQDGITVIDIASILTKDYATEGVMTGHPPQEDALASIAIGQDFLTLSGQFDIGQSCVVEGNRIIAVEAAEGTDAMLDRVAGLRDPDLGPLVMVKMLKSGQDRALDPPGIGVETIKRAGQAGISIIALEAGGVMMVDPNSTIQAAQDHGITLFGI